MSKNIFQNTVQAAQQVTEATTGGNSFAIPTTGVYPATLQLCYVKQNASKPSNTDLHFIFKLDNGFTWNYPVYSVLVNGQAHQTDKDGKPKINYGFMTATRLFQTFTGKSLAEAGENMAQKIIEVYNFDQAKNLQTTVDVFADTIGAKGFVGLTRKIENKKTSVDGTWVNLPERKEVAVMSTSANLKGQTYTEVMEKLEPTKLQEWSNANTGKDWNAYQAVAGSTNVPSQPATTGAVINFG